LAFILRIYHDPRSSECQRNTVPSSCEEISGSYKYYPASHVTVARSVLVLVHVHTIGPASPLGSPSSSRWYSMSL